VKKITPTTALVLAACLASTVGVPRVRVPEAGAIYRIDERTQRVVLIRNAEPAASLEFLQPKPMLLTIDDGPANTEVDLKILAILKEHHAHALWFITCKTLDPKLDPAAEEHRQVLKQIVADGHILGNHGYSHLDLRDLDARHSPQLEPEISECSHLIESIAGVRPKYFRPPFGKTSPRILELVRMEGMQSVLWTSDTFDWVPAYQSYPAMFMNYVRHNPALDVAAHAEPGGILLMHDHSNTAGTLDELLTKLERRRFAFVVPG